MDNLDMVAIKSFLEDKDNLPVLAAVAAVLIASILIVIFRSGPTKKASKKKNKKKAKKGAPVETKKAPAASKKKNKKKSKQAKKQEVVKVEPEEIEEDDDADIFALIAAQGNNVDAKSMLLAKKKKEKKKTAAPAEASKPVKTDGEGFEVQMSKKAQTEYKKAQATMKHRVAAAKAAGLEAPTTLATHKKTRRGGKNKKKNVEGIETVTNEDGTVATGRKELFVQSRHYGLIIGPGGSTLMKLQEGSGANIDVPNKESDRKSIVVTGTSQEVSNCCNAINALISKGYSAYTHGQMDTSSINVREARELGIIIGPKGANIKAIQDATGAKINTPERNSNSNKITINGPDKDSVNKARNAIKDLLTLGFSSITHPGWVVQHVEFPTDKIRTLVGPGGHTIKSIRGDTKTNINIPKGTVGLSTKVAVSGPLRGVEKAKKQILNLLIEKEEKPKKGGSSDPRDDDYDPYFDDDY